MTYQSLVNYDLLATSLAWAYKIVSGRVIKCKCVYSKTISLKTFFYIILDKKKPSPNRRGSSAGDTGGGSKNNTPAPSPQHNLDTQKSKILVN